jgi:hypothetical protein
MSLATVAAPPIADLAGLVDAAALATGAWVVVESAGLVLTHGTGRTPCPPAVAAALLSKSTAPLRTAVVWRRGVGRLRGHVDGVRLTAADLGGGATGWFIAADVDQATIDLLAAAVHAEAPTTDAYVEELLNPRALRRQPAPDAVLLAVRADAPVAALSTHVRRLLAGTAARVHAEPHQVLVALPPETCPGTLLQEIRDRVGTAVGGTARVLPNAGDWVVAHRLASACAEVAAELGLPFGDPQMPRVVAELLVREARQSAAELVGQLPEDPLAALRDYDARSGTDLVASLRAWCRAGFDVAAAATALHLHQNTLRYRLHRAEAITCIDLADARQRMALQLLTDLG